MPCTSRFASPVLFVSASPCFSDLYRLRITQKNQLFEINLERFQNVQQVLLDGNRYRDCFEQATA
jgi:hypothetical protein